MFHKSWVAEQRDLWLHTRMTRSSKFMDDSFIVVKLIRWVVVAESVGDGNEQALVKRYQGDA